MFSAITQCIGFSPEFLLWLAEQAALFGHCDVAKCCYDKAIEMRASYFELGGSDEGLKALNSKLESWTFAYQLNLLFRDQPEEALRLARQTKAMGLAYGGIDGFIEECQKASQLKEKYLSVFPMGRHSPMPPIILAFAVP